MTPTPPAQPALMQQRLAAACPRCEDQALGAAWRRCEAALPGGWLLDAIERRRPDGWVASGRNTARFGIGSHGYGPTPTAALENLADKLEAGNG